MLYIEPGGSTPNAELTVYPHRDAGDRLGNDAKVQYIFSVEQ